MLNLLVEVKQPNNAKLPIVAGSRLGTRLSIGEGEDDTGVVEDTPPGPLEPAGTEGEDCTGVFPGPEAEGAAEPAGPEDAGPEGSVTGLFPEAGPEVSGEPADPDVGGNGVLTGPEAELFAELGGNGGVAIGGGTEPLAWVLADSIGLATDEIAELSADGSVVGRLDDDVELDGETAPKL